MDANKVSLVAGDLVSWLSAQAIMEPLPITSRESVSVNGLRSREPKKADVEMSSPSERRPKG